MESKGQDKQALNLLHTTVLSGVWPNGERAVGSNNDYKGLPLSHISQKGKHRVALIVPSKFTSRHGSLRSVPARGMGHCKELYANMLMPGSSMRDRRQLERQSCTVMCDVCGFSDIYFSVDAKNPET